MTKSEGAASILAQMTAQITGSKQAAGGSLTPVVGEGKGSLPEAGSLNMKKDWTTGSPIPNDRPGGVLPDDPDIILGRLRAARREVEMILASIDRLEGLWSVPQEAPVPQVAEQAPVVVHATESEDGGGFAAKFEELSKRAQGEVFSPMDHGRDNFTPGIAAPDTILYPTDDPAEPTVALDIDPGGWACPVHGTANLLLKTSPKGRQYIKCTAAGCVEFEK